MSGIVAQGCFCVLPSGLEDVLPSARRTSMMIWLAAEPRRSKISAGTAMRSKRCWSFSCNIDAMVVAGSGAMGKRVLCSSRAARDVRKLMAMRHEVCKCSAFSLVTKVTLENLHAVPVWKRL